MYPCTTDECRRPAEWITDYLDGRPEMPLCDAHAMGNVVPLDGPDDKIPRPLGHKSAVPGDLGVC